MATHIYIDGSRIRDRESFHDVFAAALGFPAFYGRNMDAWIDCMMYVDDADAGLSSVHVAEGDFLVLCVSDMDRIKKHCPTIYADLIECSGFVNHRRIDKGFEAVLALSFY